MMRGYVFRSSSLFELSIFFCCTDRAWGDKYYLLFQPFPSLFFPFHTRPGLCSNLMKRSTAARLASGVQSALLYVRRPGSESSERRSVLVPWPGCYQSFHPSPPPPHPAQRRSQPATPFLPSSFLFFLHLHRSQRAMQMHATNHPPTTPICYFKSLFPSVSGSARGWQNQGRWDESREGWVGGLRWGGVKKKKHFTRLSAATRGL